MNTLKSVIQFIIVIGLVLLSIWSQSWVLTIFLFIVCIIVWHPSIPLVQAKLKALLNPLQLKIAEWSLAICLSLFFIWFSNQYLVSFYSLQSSSMNPSYHKKELIIINKIAYGPALNRNNSQLYRRLKGYNKPKHGEVIALHFPEADTCFQDYLDQDYHFIKRQYATTNNYTPILDNKVIFKQVQERPVYIKRLVALPGDTLRIIDGDYYINNNNLGINQLSISKYELSNSAPTHLKDRLLKHALSSYQENDRQILEIQNKIVFSNPVCASYLTRKEEVMNMPNTYVFPFKTNYFWNASYLGPIILPTKGKTVRLTLTNIPLYKRIIESYEGNSLKIVGDQIFINDRKTIEYTFLMNYYWVAGDNKKHSFDSRYWGFVPENHIIGRVEKLKAGN